MGRRGCRCRHQRRHRTNGESAATEGPPALRERLAHALATVAAALPQEPTDRWIQPPAGPWSLSLNDFLLTRMMELVVHSDDLAVSVGCPTPPFPESVTEPVLALLVGLSVRRHSPIAMVRALTRRERAPQTVAAF